MTAIQLGNLLVDALLACSIVYLAASFFRSPRIMKMTERISALEDDIRELIDKANEAGQDLNRNLLKRRRELEELLSDLQAIESKLAKRSKEADQRAVMLKQTITTTEDEVEMLSARIEQLRKEANAMDDKLIATPQATDQKDSPSQDSQHALCDDAVVHSNEEERERPSDKTSEKTWIPLANRIEKSTDTSAGVPSDYDYGVDEVQTSSARGFKGVNIYGEPIAASDSEIDRETATARSIEAAMNKGIKANKEANSPEKVDPDLINKIIQSAKELLLEGKDDDFVARSTRLPLSAIEKIRKQLGIQPDSYAQGAANKPVDERLGVLGGMSRGIHTV